jgi:glycosyltransferase involved in cell wall biosynthesis
MNDLTLIIPAKNEKEALPIFLDEIKEYNYKKLIIIDTDDSETENVIKKYENIEIVVQKESGYGNALREGINKSKTEFCCIINADSSMHPKYLGEMFKLCKEKDFIFASRYLDGAGSEDDDFITFTGNKIFTLIGKIFFGLKISDILFTYILGRTESFKSLELKYHDFRLCVEIPIKIERLGMTYESIPSYERNRMGGKKKVNAFKDGFFILVALVTLFFKKK